MGNLGKIGGIVAVGLCGLAWIAACTPLTTQPPAGSSPSPTTSATPSPATLALGGRLYDSWSKAAPATLPSGNSPLWATQTTNTRTGADTWRCKECHGWDYKGKDGAYGSGSHKTGFTGVYGASSAKTVEQLAAILKGSANASHSFSAYLNDEQINALSAFLKSGVIDTTQYIDSATKKPKSADAAKGKTFYEANCASCHGADGKTLNFGKTDAPEYVGNIASDNPWEFLHKVRSGQPGKTMPAGIEKAWTIQEMLDVLAHAQTL